MTFKSGHFTAIYDSLHILCFNRRILVYFVRGNNTLLTSCLTGLDLNISKEDESKVNEEASQSTVILPLTKSVCSIRCFKICFISSSANELRFSQVVDCPEGKFYVCVKMFGGGMGDQIRRYCESIPREVLFPNYLPNVTSVQS